MQLHGKHFYSIYVFQKLKFKISKKSKRDLNTKTRMDYIYNFCEVAMEYKPYTIIPNTSDWLSQAIMTLYYTSFNLHLHT